MSEFPSRYVLNCEYDPELMLTVVPSGPLTVIEVAGVLDLSTVHVLTAHLDQFLLAHAPRWLVLDLAGVRLLSAAGVTALQRTLDGCAAYGGRLTLRNPSAMVCRILDITNMADQFDVRSTSVGPPPASGDPSADRSADPPGIRPDGRIDA